jgi:hypothetical protein
MEEQARRRRALLVEEEARRRVSRPSEEADRGEARCWRWEAQRR